MNSINATREKEIINTFGKAIYTAIKNQGLEILDNINKIKGYLIDIYPEFKQEIYIFSKTFNKEYLKIYKEAFLQEEIETKQNLAKLRYYFTEKEGIAPSWVDMLYTNCYEAILCYKREKNSKRSRKDENQLNNIYLQKGQKIFLGQAIKKIYIGVEYNINKHKNTYNFEIDIVAFLLDKKGKCVKDENFIFYNNLIGDNEAIIHQGNSLTNLKHRDDQILIIDFQKIPLNIQKIAICASIDKAKERNQNFSQISELYVKLTKITSVENTKDIKQLQIKLKDEFTIETSLVLCEIYKYQNDWKINVIAAGFQEGLVALLNNYGLKV